MEARDRKPGRPLRGARKRIRTSFTLSPDDLVWLDRTAREKGISRSEMMDHVLASARGTSVARRARIPVPLDRIQDFCRRHGVGRFLLFGSVLTEDFGAESDIDVLVEFESDRAPGFFGMARMQRELSDIFGRGVDLRTPAELSGRFRERVLREAEVIHESA